MSTARHPTQSDTTDRTPSISTEALQQDRLSLIGYMASSVAHDISNPLATIAASAQTILAFWPEKGPVLPAGIEGVSDASVIQSSPAQQLREDLELMFAEAKRAGDIVANLLAFARDDEPEWYPVSMAALIRQVIALTRNHLNQRFVTVESEALLPDFGSPDWSWVLGDATHLQQVLMNLIINAEQAIRSVQNHGKISIHLSRHDAKFVDVTVEDDGPGIPPTLHKSIFKAFYTTKDPGEGTGLGLSIAAGIISRHGGQLDVRDREEGGAAFSFRLPITELTSTPGSVGRKQIGLGAPAPNRKGSVLLVDDEAGIRRSVGRFLRRFGCDVETVGTGDEAMTALAGRGYDAVVSDLRMPGLSGEELYYLLIKAHPHMTGKVVFTSGDMMRAETRAFLRECGCPSLQKPYELGDLVSILDRLWSDSSTPPQTA